MDCADPQIAPNNSTKPLIQVFLFNTPPVMKGKMHAMIDAIEKHCNRKLTTLTLDSDTDRPRAGARPADSPAMHRPRRVHGMTDYDVGKLTQAL